MSQSKFVVELPCTVPSALPSRPNEMMAYCCADVPAKATSERYFQSLPQPSLGGSDLMYVGDRMMFIVAFGSVMPGSVMAPAALYLLTSVARASHAVAIVRMSAMVRF